MGYLQSTCSYWWAVDTLNKHKLSILRPTLVYSQFGRQGRKLNGLCGSLNINNQHSWKWHLQFYDRHVSRMQRKKTLYITINSSLRKPWFTISYETGRVGEGEISYLSVILGNKIKWKIIIRQKRGEDLAISFVYRETLLVGIKSKMN